MPKVSVVIATKNEEKNLEKCLKSILAQSQKCEIIIVDNFSTDQTLDIGKKFTKNVFSVGPERSTQRNFGLKKAQGEFVLFLDADMRLEKNVVGECLQNITNNTAGIVIDEISTGNSYLARIKNLEKKLYQGQKELEAARFFRKSKLIKIGGYDPKLISGEDWDLSQRMAALGKIVKVRAKIIHHEDQDWWQDIKKKYYYSIHIQRYAHKHPVEFGKQASPLYRLKIALSKPAIVFAHPGDFFGLIFLKNLHFLAYLAAKTKQKIT